MFSIGQYIIIGLASSVYVAGSALLLAGRFFLPGDPLSAVEAGREPAPGGREVNGGAYFVPVPERSGIGGATISTTSATGGKQVRGAHPNFSLDLQGTQQNAAGHTSGTAKQGLLTTPVCLN